MGLKHAAASKLGKFVEKNNPSHAICEANSVISARFGNNQKMRKKIQKHQTAMK